MNGRETKEWAMKEETGNGEFILGAKIRLLNSQHGPIAAISIF
jgi:hypothetical protein